MKKNYLSKIQKKKVSIIMSTYNTKKEYIDLAISSILNQTYQNFEFIIINDGGSDISNIQQFNDNRIVIINHDKKMGLPYSLNEAIEICTGEYIARMDSDDFSISDRLKIQVNYMDKHPEIDLCSMFSKQFGNKSNFLINLWLSSDDIHSQLFYTNVLVHPLVVFRKSFLIENNLRYSLDYPCSQDYEFWTRCSKYGKIAIIPKMGLYYRMHSSQISMDKKELQRELYETVLIRNLNELKLKNDDLKFIKMLNGQADSIELYQLSDFIDRAILSNKVEKIYNEISFEKILYNKYFTLMLKKGGIGFNIIMNKNIRRKIFKLYNCTYILKKICFTLKVKIFYFLNKEKNAIQ